MDKNATALDIPIYTDCLKIGDRLFVSNPLHKSSGMRATFAASTSQKILQTKRNADLGIFVLLFFYLSIGWHVQFQRLIFI